MAAVAAVAEGCPFLVDDCSYKFVLTGKWGLIKQYFPFPAVELFVLCTVINIEFVSPQVT